MPWIVDCLATAEVAVMAADLKAVLTDNDAIGIGLYLGRATYRGGQHRVFVVVETHEAGLADRGLHRMEPIERAGISDQVRPLSFECLPDRTLRLIDSL